MLARRIAITFTFYVVGLVFVNVIGGISNVLWEYMHILVEIPLGAYVGWRAMKVWDWTGAPGDSFYCAAALHLECDAVMGCACTCHKEWDG